MAPQSKKTSASTKKTPSRARSVMNIADKLKILDLIDNGEKIAAIARRFQVNESSIRTIRDNKDRIRNSSLNLGQHAKFVKVVRGNILEKTEEMLLIWIQDLMHKSIPVSTAAIRSQARLFHDYLNEKCEKKESFNSSKGWFENFKTRYSLHNIKFTGMRKLLFILIMY